MSLPTPMITKTVSEQAFKVNGTMEPLSNRLCGGTAGVANVVNDFVNRL